MTIIAFIGSVFSPYYAWARRKGPAEAAHFVALNVALYGAGGKRWALTERGRGRLRQSLDRLEIGPSALTWDGEGLTVSIDEWCAPIPQRVRGTVRLVPRAMPGRSFALDAAGRHQWRPIAPVADIAVDLDRPGLRWSGEGYLDSNAGTRPLEADFARWDWSRGVHRSGASVLYDVERTDGTAMSLALRFEGQGVSEHAAPPRLRLPSTPLWRVPRFTQSEGGARVANTWEDTPFYARSSIRTRLFGEEVMAMHESLSLRRFVSPVVQMMLPFRMPRLAG